MTETIEPTIGFDAAATEAESEIVRRYDRQRRQRLLVLMGATFGGLIGALFVLLVVLIVIAGTFGVSETVQLVGTGLNALLYVAVVALARRGGWNGPPRSSLSALWSSPISSSPRRRRQARQAHSM